MSEVRCQRADVRGQRAEDTPVKCAALVFCEEFHGARRAGRKRMNIEHRTSNVQHRMKNKRKGGGRRSELKAESRKLKVKRNELKKN